MIAAVDKTLSLVNDDTKIIPGHGKLGGKKELRLYRDMLAAISEKIAKLIAAGKTPDEVKSAKPTADFDEVWGKGFMTPDRFVELLFADLSRK
jgi:glyoxylase-like metal-dependent hydrolase (beta-lactamase superfamily II)